MEDSNTSSLSRTALPLILLAAVIQGWTLFALHHAVEHQQWPATKPAWLWALYAVAVFIPVSVELLAERARDGRLWIIISMFAIAFFCFGWQFGSHGVVRQTAAYSSIGEGAWFAAAFIAAIWWLLVLPFVQSGLCGGSWWRDYKALFSNAWRNKLVLAEAALFTGLFWLLLALWQTLFHMLRIDYFRELFEEPIFIYPVTSLAFGCAMHLIGSIDRLTAVILEQILSVLKWLATVAGVILALFSVALLFNLPGLVFEGQKAIGAGWLLWLVAGIVLLLNAAYRDGSVARPYPAWLSFALRLVVPLTIVVALTALYALHVRTRHYGLTVERFWAFAVALSALCYSTGYSFAALGRGVWLAGIARVNTSVAIALIGVLGLAMTPLLSPARLAADSQYRQVLEKGAPDGTKYGSSLRYLRFDTGVYGVARLQDIAGTYAGPDAEHVKNAAHAILAIQDNSQAPKPIDVPQRMAKMRVFPAGRPLDESLLRLVTSDVTASGPMSDAVGAAEELVGLFIDLDTDGIDEFVLLERFPATGVFGSIYELHSGVWIPAGKIDWSVARKQSLFDALAKGEVSVKAPRWNDLVIGNDAYRVGASK